MLVGFPFRSENIRLDLYIQNHDTCDFDSRSEGRDNKLQGLKTWSTDPRDLIVSFQCQVGGIANCIAMHCETNEMIQMAIFNVTLQKELLSRVQ